ncbi:bacillithiol biosynthesis cysteine-adding enzyme BshC [soil metagenome]
MTNDDDAASRGAPGLSMSGLLMDDARGDIDLDVLGGPPDGGGPLVRDYLSGAPGLAPFYAGHPRDPASYRRKAAEVEDRLDAAARAHAAPAIEPLGDADGRLGRILAGDGFFITSGQQPALFGGPLYTLYKALATMRLAETLEPLLGRPVLGLFWIGADDHDWDEANHASVLDADAYVRRLVVRQDAGAPPLPLSHREWGADVSRVVAEFEALLEGAPFSAEVVEHVRRAYTPNATVAGSFTDTLRFLLRDRRIALIDSAHPALRRAAAPVLRREIEGSAEHAELLTRQTEKLVAGGYPAQVAVSDDASNVMFLDEGGRDRLVRDARGWHTRREKRALAEADLLARLDAEPERFSPNVLLRPVVESSVLPTIAYVAGPGELRYFAQIGPLFEAHGVMPPVVVPRPSVTIVDARSRRLLGRLRLEPSDFRAPWHELVSTVIRRELPGKATDALRRIREGLHADYAALMDAVEAVDPTLRGPLAGSRNRSLMRANDAEKRIIRHLKRRNEVLLEQLRKSASSLQPVGKPQERVFGALPLVARYGRAVVGVIESAIDMDTGRF